ncbi:MAG: glycosyltransferase family 2 protein [Terriglobia bacterium]
MKITVILCTYNRCTILAKALNSVAASRLPESIEWEVLVVDNNSSDRTREVVEDYCRRFPGRFRYLFEPQQGLSYARNAGIREGRGYVLAFMDDDVTVEPEWLQNLTACLQDGEWAGAGGRTLPGQGFSPPRWLSFKEPYNLGGALCAVFDLGDEPQELNRAPYGANMAFRKEMFEKHGGFRIDLDRCGGNTMSNGDTEFGRRLMAAGERLRYEPSAVVYHPVPQDRVNKEYILAWWFDYGRAAIREVGHRPDILGMPRYYFSIPKGILGTVLKACQWMLAVNPQRRFFLKAFVWYFAGQIVEIYRQSRHQNPGGNAGDRLTPWCERRSDTKQ